MQMTDAISTKKTPGSTGVTFCGLAIKFCLYPTSRNYSTISPPCQWPVSGFAGLPGLGGDGQNAQPNWGS